MNNNMNNANTLVCSSPSHPAPPHHPATLHHPDDWLLGFGWDDTAWGGTLPHRSWVDEAAPGRRALLLRMDGHMALASTAALQVAEVWPTAPALGDCGSVHVDQDGRPSGILTYVCVVPAACLTLC